MTSVSFFSLLYLSLSACDDDKGFTEFNYPPEAAITSHQSGISLYEGDTITFEAALSDLNDPPEELVAKWSISGRVVCDFAAPDSFGNSSCAITIGENETEIVVEVRDPENEVGFDELTIDLIPNGSPTALIYSPLSNNVYYSDQLITFEGSGTDPEDDPLDLTIYWESSIDGVLALETTPDGDGQFVDFGYLSEGEHGLSLHVEDQNGKSDTETVTIVVGPPNSSPNCSINAPVSGDVFQVGQTVIFEAVATDPDVPSDWLSVGWSSDKDGDIGTSTPTSSGDVLFPFSDLSANSHVISMTVTDELGSTCTDNVLVLIGSPPTVQILSPASGDVYNEGELISFEGSVSDPEDIASALVLEWSSSLDGVLSNAPSDSNGTVLFQNDTLTVGSHTLSLNATDSAGLNATDIVTFQVNGLPTTPSVSITPDPAYTDNDLTGAATGSTDPEGDTITYTYEWLLSNSVQHTGTTLPASMTNKGEEWTLRATPADPYGSGTPGEASITIQNQSPEITAVTISPSSSISTNTVLTCNATSSDADTSDTLSTTYAWTAGSSPLGSGSTLDLSQQSLTPGDTVTCTATVTDGTDTVTDSADVTIDNSPPVISSVSITPSAAYNDDTLTCSVSASDPDGDPITYAYAWTNTDTGTVVGSTDTITLDSSLAASTETIECAATVTDSNGGTATDTDNITLDNRSPTLSSIAITPSSGVMVGSTLSCSATGSDIDADSTTIQYQWSSNGVPLQTGASLTVTTGMAPVGGSILCTATITDTNASSDTGSTSVTLDNSPPVVTVTITPSSGVYNDTTLTCNASASDPDGGSPTLTYEWSDGNFTLGVTDTLTLSPNIAPKGTTITCNATADDTYDTVTESDSVSIENSPPEIIFATIDPSMLYTDDIASISFISNDADGDAVTTNIDWYVDDGNGAVLVSTSATLDGSTAFEKGDVIYAELTPNDGFDDGATVTTSSMTISNTPPEAPVIAIQPSAPIEGEDDMICAVTVDSNDADTADLSNISYTIEWYENSVLFTSTSTTTITGDTISASETTKDEVWECVVIPSDGTDTGTSTSTSVIIQQDCDIDDDGFDAPSCGGPDCDDTDPTIGDCFDGSGTWADTTTTLESVVHHVAALDEDETNGELRILVYGGQSYYQLLDQLWEYNIDTDTWASLSYSGVSPEPVYKHAAAFSSSAQQWLIFGGQTYYALSEDLYVLDTNAGSETWYMTSVSSTSSPEARLGSTMVIDSNTDKAYVIGGQGYYTLLDDVWSIDLNNDLNLSTSGSTVSWTEETPGGTLPAVVGASGGFDPNFDSIYLFGGQTYYKLLDSTPCLDLQTMTWTDATLTGDSLPAMVWASVTWSDFIGGFLIHGGQSYYQLIEESYAVIPSASCTAEVITVTPSGDTPPAMLGASLVYDATSGMHYILGGQGYYTLYDSLISFQP